MAGGNHATTEAVVVAKENAEGNRVACNKRKIEIELVRQLQRQAPLRSGSAMSRATADGSSSNCSFSFSTAGSTVSYTARGRSHHGRTNASTKIHCNVQLTLREQERETCQTKLKRVSVKATSKSTVRSSSLLETKRDTRPNSIGMNGAIGEQFNVMLGTVPQPQDSHHVLIYIFPLQSSFCHRLNRRLQGSPHLELLSQCWFSQVHVFRV